MVSGVAGLTVYNEYNYHIVILLSLNFIGVSIAVSC